MYHTGIGNTLRRKKQFKIQLIPLLMRRKKINSSSIRAIGYDDANKMLEVEFHNETVYRYFNVNEMLYLSLRNAPSVGSFFNEKIRDAGFSFKKIK